MIMKQEQIEAMRKAFAISVAAFDAVHTISGIFTTIKPPKSLMHKLHIITLNELNDDKPNQVKIDKYLSVMESLAELNAHEQKAKENEKKKV
jgi:uncharacterized membrane protein